MSNNAKKSSPSSITKADVISNVDPEKTASLTNGIIRLTYHESILQDTVKAYVVFSDVGLAIDNKSVIEGLPLIGTEDFRLEFEDNNEEKIRVSMNIFKFSGEIFKFLENCPLNPIRKEKELPKTNCSSTGGRRKAPRH